MKKTAGMTLTEKILLQHAVGWNKNYVQAGDILNVRIDWTIASELAWNGMSMTYEALGRPPLANKDRFYLALDHTVDRGTLETDLRTQALVQLSRNFAREARLKYFYDANQTIMHTEFFRQLVRPGEIVLGADSHTSSHGGMAARPSASAARTSWRPWCSGDRGYKCLKRFACTMPDACLSG
jgi:aconitate hydratase/homoaconitate hydratase